jgi:hypothetical protein
MYWLRVLALVVVLGFAAGCQPTPPVTSVGVSTGGDAHIPPYARVPYQPFSREAAVQIAMREWRAFGQVVVYPNTELPFDREREEGLWQRVGDYWWQGLPLGTSDASFTGIHDANGRVFSEREDGNYAWSAAFVDYVMRKAGAGNRFPYASTHSDYINAARRQDPGIVISAERPESYAPQRGDLICMWRGRQPVRYDDLPTGRFPGHCDIVISPKGGSLDVIGGNVDNSVSLKHVPATAEGRLADASGAVVDPDHPWFVVLRVTYDR